MHGYSYHEDQSGVSLDEFHALWKKMGKWTTGTVSVEAVRVRVESLTDRLETHSRPLSILHPQSWVMPNRIVLESGPILLQEY